MELYDTLGKRYHWFVCVWQFDKNDFEIQVKKRKSHHFVRLMTMMIIGMNDTMWCNVCLHDTAWHCDTKCLLCPPVLVTLFIRTCVKCFCHNLAGLMIHHLFTVRKHQNCDSGQGASNTTNIIIMLHYNWCSAVTFSQNQTQKYLND